MTGQADYATSHGKNVAFRVFGEGPDDVVIVHPLMATMRQFTRASSEIVARLARIARVIVFDPRGNGMSDPLPLDDLPMLDDWADDIIAVMDAAGSQRAMLAGFLGGGQMAISAAVRYPDRVTSLVIMHAQAASADADDYPWGVTKEQLAQQAADIRRGWRDMTHVERFGSGTTVEGYRRHMQQVGSPEQVAALLEHANDFDVRPLLPKISTPTFILHRRDNRWQPLTAGRYIAERIPDATLVVLDGDAQNPMVDTGQIVDEIEHLLTGSRPAPEPQRVLAAVLFTDIVASTVSKAKSGDKRWRDVLTEHNAIVRGQITRHGGQVVSTAGDGFLASFDAPLRAIRCANAIIDELGSTGLHIRAGIHAGEVERMDDDITGLTVDIGARVCALAGPDEILVSSTVHDMAIGSGVAFEERGEHDLKGVPGRWRLYTVAE